VRGAAPPCAPCCCVVRLNGEPHSESHSARLKPRYIEARAKSKARASTESVRRCPAALLAALLAVQTKIHPLTLRRYGLRAVQTLHKPCSAWSGRVLCPDFGGSPRGVGLAVKSGWRFPARGTYPAERMACGKASNMPMPRAFDFSSAFFVRPSGRTIGTLPATMWQPARGVYAY
jgi:hypothetical protein